MGVKGGGIVRRGQKGFNGEAKKKKSKRREKGRGEIRS